VMSLLVRTPAPYAIESLQSYILRLSERNGYDTPVHILQVAGMTAHSMHGIDVPLGSLVDITGCDFEKLKAISNIANDAAYHSKILNENLQRSASTSQFDLRRAFFCPHCAEDDGYIEAFWSLSYAVGCPKHGCVPITHCVECGEKVSWFRPGLLTCRCGANFSDQSLETLDEDVNEFMKIIALKVYGFNLGGLKNKSGYPIKYFDELSLSSLLLIMNVLQKQYYKCHEPHSNTHSREIDSSVNIFKNWPHGYHAFLNNLGEYYETTRPPESALRKQFELFYLALFKNSSFKKEAVYLKSEFIEFGKGVWGKGYIDKKLLDNQSLTSGMRYLTKSQFCERTGMSPRVLNMIIDSRYINKKTIPSSNGGSRVIIDMRGTLIPEVFFKTVPIREAGASLGVPVSVLKYLKEGTVSTESLHRGRKETWFVEEIKLLMQSAREHAKPLGFYKQEMVCLKNIMNKKLKSTELKSDIVSAVIDGVIQSECSIDSNLSGFMLDKSQVDRLIKRHTSLVEISTLGFTEVVDKTGLDSSVINDAITQNILVATTVEGHVRITAESVDYFCGNYVVLSGVAHLLNTNTRLLLRLCKSNDIEVIALKRNSKHGTRGSQPIILTTHKEKLVLAREDELKRARKRQRKDLTLKYEKAVRRYFKILKETSASIPMRAGKPNKMAIAKACGFSRHVIYTYPSVIKLMNEFLNDGN